MKKRFVEPQMKKIELNLKENIAASGHVYYKYNSFDFLSCTIHMTLAYMLDLAAQGRFDLIETCKMYSTDASSSRIRSGGGILIQESEVRRYL